MIFFFFLHEKEDKIIILVFFLNHKKQNKKMKNFGKIIKKEQIFQYNFTLRIQFNEKNYLLNCSSLPTSTNKIK